MKKLSSVIMVALIALSGCSYLTKSGRQQAAYARYIRHSSYARVKMQKRFSSSPKIPPAQMQPDPTVTTSSGPESVSASVDSGPQ